MRALSDEQAQVVARRGEPLLLSAGAGSGKTSVLVERFVGAVCEDGVAPGRILAITFTERAAGELRARLRERLLDLGAREAARETEMAFVCTFHSFCARLLHAHPLLAGLDPEFAILDEGLAGRMRERAFTAALRDFLDDGRTGAVDLLAAYGPERVRSMVDRVYAELRSRGERRPRLPLLALGPAGQSPAEVPASRCAGVASPEPALERGADALDPDGIAACRLLDELLERFAGRYEALKRARSAVDFDDLELCARELLCERESVRAEYSQRFELLMVDEFQDTNARQLAILTALERENLFTVGDELQSIYSFRHADVSLFRARRSELAKRGASLQLTRNFRSRPPLLDVVNAVFEGRFGAGHAPLLAGREDAGGEALAEPLVELLLTSRRGGDEDEPPLVVCWREAEARLLAARVAQLVREGHASAGEVVVLLRAVGEMEVYERALQEYGLRTLAAAGGFWRRREVGDLLAYLRALANPLDEPALYGTLASPLVGLSSDGLALLAHAASAARQSVWETIGEVDGDAMDKRHGDAMDKRHGDAMDKRHGDPMDKRHGDAMDKRDRDALARLPPGDRQALVEFRVRFAAERRTAPQRTISQLIEYALDRSGYREHVLGLEWGHGRLANIHKLLRLARRFEGSEGRDLRGFLDYAAHQDSQLSGSEPDAPVTGIEPDAVRLMSIHAAKGLEFPVVCVADLGRAQNLSVPDLLVDGDRVGLRLVRLDGAQAQPSLDFERLSEQRRRAQAEEEERILYVAMTRARERLLLSGAVDFEHWPQPRLGAPTVSWLGPALVADLPAIVGAGEQTVWDVAVGERGAVRVRCRRNASDVVGGARALGRGEEVSGPVSLPALGAPSSIRAADILDTNAHQLKEEQRERHSPSSPATRTVDTIAHNAEEQQQRPHPLETLSYTTLAELERCGYRYYLERVLGLPENRSTARARSSGNGLSARTRGTLVHRLLESIDFARPVPPSVQDVAALARELGVRVGPSEREEIATLVGGAFKVGGAASAVTPGARVAAAESVRREHQFAFCLGPDQLLFTGVIDLLARERDGGFLVLDYKTDRVDSDEDLDAVVEHNYGVQRLLYALAVLRAGAPRVEIVHWFLHRPHDWIAASYRSVDRNALEERLAARIQRARSFSVSKDPHRDLCETCPGRATVCCYDEAETLRE
jgi:ATP-dependent helicase/nuclease subunit A